jgi:hypothetical protein
MGLKSCFLFVRIFDDAVCNSDYIRLNDLVIVNNELEGMWKEVVVA